MKALLILALVAMATQANAQSMCGERTSILKVITEKYQETARSIAITGQANVVEIFASKAGTWTFLITAPDGRSCIFGAGQGWKDLPQTPGVPL